MTTNARPAPAWDEEAVVAAVARAIALAGDYDGCFERLDAWADASDEARECGDVEEPLSTDAGDAEFWLSRARAAVAVVRDRLPVKPGREAVRLAQHRALMPQVMSIFAAVGGTQADYDALLDTLADAVLSLLPGRSEAEVKAEALREAADEVERIDPEWDSALWIADPTSERGGAYHPVETWLRARADRLAAEGGDDRG